MLICVIKMGLYFWSVYVRRSGRKSVEEIFLLDSLLAVCFQVFARSTSVIVAVINMIICLRKVLRNLTARFVQNLLKKIKSVHIGGLLFFSFSIVGSISLLSMVPSRRHWRICFSQELLIWISWGLLRYRNVRHAIENTVF